MKPRYWSLAIILLLVNYLIFAMLFSKLLGGDFTKKDHEQSYRTPWPTFTPAPAEPPIVIPTPTPFTPMPTPTNTRVLNGAESNAPTSTPPAQLMALSTVNVRSGPGISYGLVGQLNANIPMPVAGRNADGTWWQIQLNDGALGWVDTSVVQITNPASAPVVEAPTAVARQASVPQPAAKAPEKEQEKAKPAPKAAPKFQYEPTGWYNETNKGLTRFLGTIKDGNGAPVNGVFIKASCGDYATISFPSGPTGWGPRREASDWPAGFYDITVDTKPVPCMWVLSVVDTEDRKTVKATLSEQIPVEVTVEKSIIVANWRRNW